MIGTAVDTNVLSEILLAGPGARTAAGALTRALQRGPVVVSPIVYAELRAAAPEPDEVDALLAAMSVEVEFDLPPSAVRAASSARRAYLARRRAAGAACGHPHTGFRCNRCGSALGGPRHILADFLVGAHALLRASSLLTWDRGIYGTYFPDLEVLRPEDPVGG